jgi:thioredoxin reductase
MYKTKRVVLAIGRRGTPRKLNIPGETLPKVAYSLREPEAFQNDRIVVVGGGDSAVEAALALSGQPDNQVTVMYRRDSFSRIKEGNHERIEAAINAGKVQVIWNSSPTEITPSTIVYRNGTPESVLPNDAVFIFAGGVLPTRFLRDCGIEIDTKFGSPL